MPNFSTRLSAMCYILTTLLAKMLILSSSSPALTQTAPLLWLTRRSISGEKICPQPCKSNESKCLNCKQLDKNTHQLPRPSGLSLNWPWMLRQTLEALVKSWENFFSMREKPQKVPLAKQRLWPGSSSALAPRPENDFWTHAGSCRVSQPRGNLPTGFWSCWTLCWMLETIKLLLDFLLHPIPHMTHWHSYS